MVVRPYVGKTRKQDGSSYGCISNKLYDNNELVLCTLKHFLFFVFFSGAALANKMANITHQFNTSSNKYETM